MAQGEFLPAATREDEADKLVNFANYLPNLHFTV